MSVRWCVIAKWVCGFFFFRANVGALAFMYFFLISANDKGAVVEEAYMNKSTPVRSASLRWMTSFVMN